METIIKDRCARLRMRVGPLAPYLDSFAEQLEQGGYTRRVAHYQIRLVAGFSVWLESKRIAVEDVRFRHACDFLEGRIQKLRRGDAATLDRMMDLLTRLDVLDRQIEPDMSTPLDEAIDRYTKFLRVERGLAAATIFGYSKYVRQFLLESFHEGQINYPRLSPEDVINFVQRQAKVLPQKQAQYLTSALRSFFSYTRYQGYTVADLAAAVPAVPCWSKSGIPKGISLSHIDCVLASCDRRTVGGRRDYAILLLLARLGLRGGEIVKLRLDDVDWHNGCISVRGKGNSCSQLPLPSDVGEAIAEYLRNGRTKHESRSLFLTERAPAKPFADQQAIGSVVRRAIARAGIDTPRKGAHQFRHALATSMLGQGASLSEIGEILRHRLPSTTAIYAKVDLLSLRELALPWPGGVQ